jgi:hypothetical protein
MVFVELITFFVKLALLAYIIISSWRPIVSINRFIDLSVVKVLLLLAIITSAMYDVPLAILLTVTMIVAIVSEGTKAIPAKVHTPTSKDAIKLKGANLRIYDPKQNSVIPPMPVNTAQQPNIKQDEPLAQIDQDIMRISHVPEERLASAQTSALDPDLIGYEEELVASIDMPTLLLSKQN